MIKNLHTAPQLENSFTAWSETLRNKLEAKLDEMYSSKHQLVAPIRYCKETAPAEQDMQVLIGTKGSKPTSDNLQVAVSIWSRMRTHDRLAILEKHLILRKTHKKLKQPNFKESGSTLLFCRIFIDEFVDIIQQFKD
jgi:hypothetical protein